MIKFETQGALARLTLQREPLNIFNLEMLAELNRCLDEVNKNPQSFVLLIESELEKGFSAGVEVADHQPSNVHEMLTSFHRSLRLLERWNVISVAKVHGHCLGGGAELALSCDFVVADKDATFGFPEIKLGCFPPAAAAFLANRVGRPLANDLILTGRNFSAEEAYRFGLVSRLADSGQLQNTTQKLLDELQNLSPSVLQVTRRAIRSGSDIPFSQALWGAEEVYREQLLNTLDYQEGIAAFLEKRPPKWSGR